MSKRKLTKQQQARIKQQHASHIKQARQLPDIEIPTGLQGVVIANHGKTVLVENNVQQIFSCNVRQNLQTLVCGDHVIWQQEDDATGIVLAMEPRSNFLARPDRRGQARVVAANIDQLLIVSASKPALNTRLIDRYLLAAELSHIVPVIVFNKTDLPDNIMLNQLKEELAVYSALGYEVVFTSAKQQEGIHTLQSVLLDKVSVFVGQSGVGKSSLINAVLPEALAEVGDISDSTEKGRHTTTLARLYHLPSGGELIDSPGIREFGLWQVQVEQAAVGFIDFRPYIGQCRFRNCLHEDEPGCSIREAVENGAISAQRWESYRRILETLREGN